MKITSVEKFPKGKTHRRYAASMPTATASLSTLVRRYQDGRNQDGEVLEPAETEWDVPNPDPQYHFDAIVKAMRDTISKAEKKGFGKIEAVGGSATGTVSEDNDATLCDIFPNVPPDVYKEKVFDIFKRIAKEVAGDVPLKVINDGSDGYCRRAEDQQR